MDILNGENFDTMPASIQALKPKPEVYAHGDLFQTTRNVCGMNAICTPLLQAIFTPVFKSRPKFDAEDLVLHPGPIPSSNMNLMGWSPTHGFFQKVIGHFKEVEDNSFGVYYYADNLYLFEKRNGDVIEISMDGEKMECSHDLDDA